MNTHLHIFAIAMNPTTQNANRTTTKKPHTGSHTRKVGRPNPGPYSRLWISLAQPNTPRVTGLCAMGEVNPNSLQAATKHTRTAITANAAQSAEKSVRAIMLGVRCVLNVVLRELDTCKNVRAIGHATRAYAETLKTKKVK